MADWFWMKNGEKHGPVDTAHLKQLARTGQLEPTDTIWREGLPDWLPASKAKGLEFHASPPGGDDGRDKSPSLGHPNNASERVPERRSGKSTEVPAASNVDAHRRRNLLGILQRPFIRFRHPKTIAITAAACMAALLVFAVISLFVWTGTSEIIISGDAYLVRNSGESFPLPGMTVRLLKPEILHSEARAATLRFVLTKAERVPETNPESDPATTLQRLLDKWGEKASTRGLIDWLSTGRSSILKNRALTNSGMDIFDFAAVSTASMDATRQLAEVATVAKGTTDREGRFSIPNVPEGKYVLYAESDSATFRAMWVVDINTADSNTVVLNNDNTYEIRNR